MSICHVQELEGVILSLFEDLRTAYPTLGGEIDRDISRLRRSIEQRGIHLLVVDLPAIGKHLDRCISDGEYKFLGLPLTKRVSKKVRVPKFLRELYLLIFEGSGRLKDDPSVEAILFLRQILFVGKKADLHCGPEAVVAEVQQMLRTDSELPIPEEVWNAEFPAYSDFQVYQGFYTSPVYRCRIAENFPASQRQELWDVLWALDIVSRELNTALGVYDFRDWRFRHGPGVVSTSPRGFSKYYWKSWSNRLENAFPIAECGYHNYASWAGSVDQVEDDSIEPFSKLIDVPKSFTKPRLIAAEPGEHQWCQQNIWDYFCTRTERSWISNFVRFRDQTRNQDLCRRGSEDGSLVTLDLSEASDRVTCHAVGQLFRFNAKLSLALQATRTRRLWQTQDENSPEFVELRKFSTMGNACTFPVETLMFLAVSLASILTVRMKPVNLRNILSLSEEVAVFGDDIVVPSDSRELVQKTLEVLHFKVNTNKSFWNGKFRESCGVDAYAGVNVTPTYWSSPCTGGPESLASTVETRNSFHKKFFLRTSSYLASTIRGVELPHVPMESGLLGLKAFAKGHNESVKTRWNPDLQRSESLVPVIISRVKKTPVEDDTALLQFFTERPDPMFPWQSGVAQRPKLRKELRWVPSEYIP